MKPGGHADSHGGATVWARAPLVGAALLLSLGAAEAVLRGVYDDLPSLAPLARAETYFGHDAPPIATSPADSMNCRDPPGSTAGGSGHVAPPTREHAFGDGEPTRSILVAGDSVAWGYGVAPEEAWGSQLGAALFQALGNSLSVGVVGVPGGGYCEVLRALHHELDATDPDAVVLQVFADDLEQRAMIILDGAPVVFPASAGSPWVRGLVAHSYAANWAWSRFRARRSPGPTRFISEEGQAGFQSSMKALRERLDELGTDLLVFLLPPSGTAACGGPGPQEQICRWYAEDMDRMEALLWVAGIAPLRLDTLWSNPSAQALPQELRRSQTEPAYVPIHPSAAGHTHLAQALAPQVAAALSP